MNARMDAVRALEKKIRRLPEIEPKADHKLTIGIDLFNPKTLLLRSEEKLNKAVLRLLHLCGVKASSVYSILEIKQEYFVIDRRLFLLRPDLVACGRTVFGAKGQKRVGEGKERALDFLKEFEKGVPVPVKIGLNEVAPTLQNIEFLPEKTLQALEYQWLCVQLLHKMAVKHGLACLFHQKPFAGIDSAGVRAGWSLVTENGLHLLDPKQDRLIFAVLSAAILRAVREHEALLQASGVYHPSFVDGKMTFQIGGLSHGALSLAVYQAVVADRLELILDEMADVIKDRSLSGEALFQTVLPVLQKQEKGPPMPSQGWPWIDKKSVRALEGVMSEEELQSLHEVWLKQQVETLQNEARLMIELFQTQILPVLLNEREAVEWACAIVEEMEKRQLQMSDMGWEAKAKVFSELLIPKMEELRKRVDQWELKVDDAIWPLPKYREMLFLL